MYTTTPLILMMIRTAGSERNNSLSGYHTADPSAAKKVGVDGSLEDEEVMGCGSWVGSQIRQQGACDGDEMQDDPGDSSRHWREQPVQFFAARCSALRHRQRVAGLEECIPLCWRSTSTVCEEIPSVCSQSIDPTVDVGILLVCSGSCQELRLTPMQHVLTLTMGVQLSKLAMSMHEDACRWQCWSVTITCMEISSRRWAESRLRGRVRAWTEACRVRASRCSLACQELSRESSAAWSKEGHSVVADCIALCLH